MRSLIVQIPQPCPENWAEMQLIQQGRFCAGCQKTVVDYTALSDQEVVRLLSQSSETSCGRFRNEQLNRPLVPSKPGTPPGWRHWAGVLTVGLFGWQTARAQLSQTSSPLQPTTVQPLASRHGNSATAIPARHTASEGATWTITGNVILLDSSHRRMPVSGARIAITRMGQTWETQTDSTGAYRLPIPAQWYTTALTVWASTPDNVHGKTALDASPSATSIVANDIILHARMATKTITGGGIVLVQAPSRWQKFRRNLFH